MVFDAVDGRPGLRRCPRCNRSGSRCFCRRLPRIANRTAVHVLQHPREQRHRAGTAPFVVGSLAQCGISVARERAGRITAPAAAGAGVALLYPGEDSVDLATMPADRRPTGLLVLDGTWSQAKRLYHDNPWLAELPKVHLDPASPSRYLVRREPRDDYLSTVESVVEALSLLEPDLVPALTDLRAVFEVVMREQYGLMTAVDRTPRMQQPRRRASRAVADDFLDEPFWVVHTEQVWCTGSGGRVLRPVHWAALEIASGEAFEAVLRPEAGDPDTVHLGHIGIAPERVARGETAAEALARFRERAHGTSPLAAWSRLPLKALRRLGLAPPREFLIKVLCANLRQPMGGGPEALAAGLGLTIDQPHFVGRGARRIASVYALARWARARGAELREQSLT